MMMKPGCRVYGNDELELSVADFKFKATPKAAPTKLGGGKCAECRNRFQISYDANFMRFDDIDLKSSENWQNRNEYISDIVDMESTMICDCCCDVQNSINHSKNRFTLNVNFTSTPKFNKFRRVSPPPQQRYECCGGFIGASTKKPSLLSLNDYLRRLLQSKKKSSTSTNNLRQFDIFMRAAAAATSAAATKRSSQHSHRHRHQKRTSLRRRTSSRNQTKSSPIDFRQFCDLKFNETNNYNTSSGFNQLGQLKVWYV